MKPEEGAWPGWLEDKRISDKLLEDAYACLLPRFRVGLKAAISLSCFHFNISPITRSETVCSERLGYKSTKLQNTVPWSLIIFSGSYKAPARLVSAAILPLLAGSGLIGAVCVGSPQCCSLSALELCGIEDIFNIGCGAIETLIDTLLEKSAACQTCAGRIILLHDGELSRLALFLRNRNVAFFEENKRPTLFVEDKAVFDLELISYAHGVPINDLIDEKTDSQRIDALYMRYENAFCDVNIQSSRMAGKTLVLTPGCEAFWLHGMLAPDYFFNHCNIFGKWSR